MSLLDDQPRTRVLLPDPPPSAGRPSHRRRLRYAIAGLVVVGLVIASAVLPRLQHHRPHTAAKTPAPQTLPTSTSAAPPARNAVGVPIGYAHTPAGASSAAANYVVGYGSNAMFLPAWRHAIVNAITDPAVTPAVQAQLDETFTAVSASFGLDPQGRPPRGLRFVCRALPVGVRLLAYRGDTARVSVWSDGIVGLAGAASTKPVAEAWTTTDVTLHWTHGDWKWVSATQHDGPTPVSGMQPASDADAIATAVATYDGLRYAR